MAGAIIDVNLSLECIFDAYEESRNEYLEWSGGSQLWEAPEYLINVNIAKQFAQRGLENFLLFEMNALDALKQSRSKFKGIVSKDWRPDGKIDIMLYDSHSNFPLAPIEVKNLVANVNCISNDVRRVSRFVSNSHGVNRIKFGIVSFYSGSDSSRSVNDAKRKLANRIKAIENQARAFCHKNVDLYLKSTGIKSFAKSEWVVGALVLEPSVKF